MNINPYSTTTHGSAQSSEQNTPHNAYSKGLLKSFFKQATGCLMPGQCGSYKPTIAPLANTHAQVLSQGYPRDILAGTSSARPPRLPDPRLSDTPMKQALAAMIRRERERLDAQGGAMFSGIGSADAMIGIALEKKDRHPKAARFSDDEFLAMHLYTTSLYRPINHHLRYQPQEDVPLVVEALKSGLAKLAQDPEYQVSDTLYRGIERYMSDREVMQRFGSGKPYRDEAFMSTSSDSRVAEGWTHRVSLRIQSSSAADVSAFSRMPFEQEVLIAPQTPFDVVSLEKKDNTWHVQLKETLDKPARDAGT